MTEHLTLDAAPEHVFADLEARTIKGLAVPLGELARTGGRVFRFLRESISFGDRVPLLMFHSLSAPVGRLNRAEWTDRGLTVEFSVSATTAGDEALVLAADGVLGFSVGVDIAPDGMRLADNVLEVHAAQGKEVSLTPVPAFVGARVESVALQSEPERVTVTSTATEVAPVAVTLDTTGLGDQITAGVCAALAAMPVPQPVPIARVTREEPLYRFDGLSGRHSFVSDLREMFEHHNPDSTQRLESFVTETFANTAVADVATLAPKVNRPDLYVGNQYFPRPLGAMVSGGALNSNQPFSFPKFTGAEDLVGPHTELIEPTPGKVTTTDQTVVPGALSGKATISREAWDRGGDPRVDQLVWSEMQEQYAAELEGKIGALLNGLTLTAVALTGEDAELVSETTGQMIALQFRKGGDTFTSLALAQDLYTALFNARDNDGRKLIVVGNAVNADGSASPDYGSLQIGSKRGIPAYGLTSHSYLFNPRSVYQWASPPQKFTFDIQVAAVHLGIFGYSAEAVTRTSDVIRLDYTA